MRRVPRVLAPLIVLISLPGLLSVQAQKPVPPPGGQQAAPPAAAAPQPPRQPLPADPNLAPSEAALGVAIYPGAQFITSYDAGQGQRYYLFGSNVPFAEVVTYYRNVLKDKGDRVFDEPPVHEFDIGRFREDAMAFPPSVTVKDYTWGGMGGFLNPKPGANPPRFKTIIQIVPSLE
jgi:hypothetical protein